VSEDFANPEVVLRPPGSGRVDLADVAVVPHLELADRLDLRVAALSRRLDEQPDPGARQTCVELMTGLSIGAEAIRALHRGDTRGCTSYLESALRHLRQVPAGAINLP
jgi:hypothetical protein